MNFRFWLVGVELRKSISLNFLQGYEKCQIWSFPQLLYAWESTKSIRKRRSVLKRGGRMKNSKLLSGPNRFSVRPSYLYSLGKYFHTFFKKGIGSQQIYRGFWVLPTLGNLSVPSIFLKVLALAFKSYHPSYRPLHRHWKWKYQYIIFKNPIQSTIWYVVT